MSDRWAISGLTGALAAMTRINGWLLVPTLATEVVQQFFSCWKWLWALMPLSGLAVYLLINYETTGHALAFLPFNANTGVRHWIGHGKAFAALSIRFASVIQMKPPFAESRSHCSFRLASLAPSPPGLRCGRLTPLG